MRTQEEAKELDAQIIIPAHTMLMTTACGHLLLKYVCAIVSGTHAALLVARS
jgi:hypothetical protein